MWVMAVKSVIGFASSKTWVPLVFTEIIYRYLPVVHCTDKLTRAFPDDHKFVYIVITSKQQLFKSVFLLFPSLISVSDPDPHKEMPPGSESGSRRYKSLGTVQVHKVKTEL